MVVADVKATLYVYMIRLMLLPITMADVIANIASWSVLLADVIAMMSWYIVTTNVDE